MDNLAVGRPEAVRHVEVVAPEHHRGGEVQAGHDWSPLPVVTQSDYRPVAATNSAGAKKPVKASSAYRWPFVPCNAGDRGHPGVEAIDRPAAPVESVDSGLAFGAGVEPTQVSEVEAVAVNGDGSERGGPVSPTRQGGG